MIQIRKSAYALISWRELIHPAILQCPAKLMYIRGSFRRNRTDLTLPVWPLKTWACPVSTSRILMEWSPHAVACVQNVQLPICIHEDSLALYAYSSPAEPSQRVLAIIAQVIKKDENRKRHARLVFISYNEARATQVCDVTQHFAPARTRPQKRQVRIRHAKEPP